MKFFRSLLSKDKKILRRQNSFRRQQELVKKIGREQFQSLMDKGLDVPVALL